MSERVTKHGLSPTHREAMAAAESRRELSPDKERALETLCASGLFKRVADIQLYHGRASTDPVGSQFVVSNRYNNAVGPAGYRNLNAIPTLSTTEDRGIAGQYARQRVQDLFHRRGIKSRAEINRIVSNDPDAIVIDMDWDSQVASQAQIAEIRDALARLALPASLEHAPVELTWDVGGDSEVKYHCYDYSKEARLLLPQLPRDFSDVVDQGWHWFNESASSQSIAREFGIKLPDPGEANKSTAIVTEKILRNMASIANSRNLVQDDPGLALYRLMRNQPWVWETSDMPLNMQYIANWANENHIVGLQATVNSLAINKELRATYMIDLNKTKTPEQLESERQSRANHLGRLACVLAMGPVKPPAERLAAPSGKLMDALVDEVWFSPERLVAKASEVPLGVPGIGGYWESFGDVFNADAGNWEGFTLGEHTETVLRNFENTYANRLPARLLPIMRLSLLVHDIGKPVAVYNGDKTKQDIYNRQWAMVFLARAGIDTKMAELVVNMITDGKRLIERAYTDNARRGIDHPDINQLDNLRNFCFIQLQKYGLENITVSDIDGLAELCLILQTCDSAAYTTMGVTHDSDNPGLYYRNYPSFEASFVEPAELTNEDARLRSVGRFT